jgi:hypothetical protein
MRTAFLSENLKGRDHTKNLGVDGKIILEWIFGKYCGRMWFRTRTSDGLL